MRKILYIIPLFILAFTFTGGPPSGWYKQTIQGPLGGVVRDMTFTDSLTGFIITDSTIFKTTNGGDNWTAKYGSDFLGSMQFVDQNTGYVGGTLKLLKTTNAGENWISMPLPLFFSPREISAINADSIWAADGSGLTGGIFRTTDGGQNWEQQYGNKTGGNGPEKVYMYNGRLGFMVDDDDIYRTSNGGVNWTQITTDLSYSDIFFIDSLNGYRASGPMYKTTDGGLNWIPQQFPSGGFILSSDITKFSIINKDTIFGVGGELFYGMGRFRGLIWKTTNGGTNWGYQIPDTSFEHPEYTLIDFTYKKYGWCYLSYFSFQSGIILSGGVHTVTGGSDTTYYTSISQVSNEIPDKFLLHQNFPNPFNPATIIRYEIKQNTEVKLNVYDITGREIEILVDGEHTPGTYQHVFNGSSFTSGVYFYKLQTTNYSETKKMLLVK